MTELATEPPEASAAPPVGGYDGRAGEQGRPAEDGAFTPPSPPAEVVEVSDGAGDGEATAEALPEVEGRRTRGVDEATEPAFNAVPPRPDVSDELERRRNRRGRR